VGFLQASLSVGGAERLVESLVMRLDRAVVEPVLLNLYEPGAIGESLARAGIRSVHGIARSKLDRSAGRRLREAYAAERIDVVHVLDSALPMWWSGLERRRSARPPLVLAFHSTGKQTDPVQYFLANRSVFPVADRFIALAESHREFLSSHFGIALDRFELIGSGVDLAVFAPDPDRRAVRARLGLPLDAPLAGIVAALRPEKNHPLFVEIAARVHARLPAARFLVVGEGLERPVIEAAIAAHGMQEVVIMLGARQDVPEIWRALDVAVLTSRIETLPVSLMEAHACGVPAVSTNVGSVRDVVADGETGLLAPAGDAAALAAALGDLLADDAKRARMSVAARARAGQCFDRNRMVRAYQDLFVRMADGHAGGS
jgi:glycosyltransferase involved in cell wall biosynthesis